MKLKHMIGRGIFASFGALLLGGIIAAGLGLFVGFISFLGTVFVPPMSLNAFIIGGIVGSSLGFLYGTYHGFKVGSFLYQKYVEKSTQVVEPTFLSGRNDTITHANALIRDIRQLPTPTQLRFLTKEEIAKYREIISEQDDRIARKKLNHYEDFIRDARNLSVSKSKDLQLQFPVTIEHKREPKFVAKTYEKNFIIDLIAKEKDRAKEPFKGYFLNSSNIHFYSGFPKWVKNFIEKVRSVLGSQPTLKPTKVIQEEKQENVTFQKPLFQPVIKPTQDSIDETIEQFNKKFGSV